MLNQRKRESYVEAFREGLYAQLGEEVRITVSCDTHCIAVRVVWMWGEVKQYKTFGKLIDIEWIERWYNAGRIDNIIQEVAINASDGYNRQIKNEYITQLIRDFSDNGKITIADDVRFEIIRGRSHSIGMIHYEREYAETVRNPPELVVDMQEVVLDRLPYTVDGHVYWAAYRKHKNRDIFVLWDI